MWQSSTPVFTLAGRELTGLDARVYLFARVWETIEIDLEDLSIEGFYASGPAGREPWQRGSGAGRAAPVPRHRRAATTTWHG